MPGKTSFLLIHEVPVCFFLGLGTHLFVKVPRPGDSEMTFTCRPISTLSLLNAERQAGKL